jgi:hypothetical protein
MGSLRWITIASAVALVVGVVGWMAWSLRDAYEPLPVYLSVGDGTQFGFGVNRGDAASEIFRKYLSERLDDRVRWTATSRGDFVTTATFISDSGVGPSQLETAEERLRAFRDEGRRVVAITLSIGGNDLVSVGNQCAEPPCYDLYFRERDGMTVRLDEIYSRINAAKDPSTPLLVLLYYNASDCGQAGVASSPEELGVIGWNAAIREVADRHRAFLVDAYTPIRGKACSHVFNLDLNERGNAILAEQYKMVYESLPAEYR